MAELPSVLFVDDDANVLAAHRRSFRRRQADWHMTFATSAAEALSAMDKTAAEVVVTDIMMPGMNGIELAEALRQKFPNTRCIILTGSNDLRLASDAVNKGGVFRFFLKPCETAALDAGIADALASRPLPNAPAAGLTTDSANLLAKVANRLSVGIIVAEPSGKVLSMNEQAAAIVAAKTALFIDGAGLLRAVDRESAKRLSAAIGAAAADGKSHTLRIEDKDGGQAVLCSLSPINAEGENAFLLLLSPDGVERAPPPEVLADLYGLTHAEARLMHRLALGETISEAAEACGITVSSARTYLKTIFGKTGVNRQTELVMRALALPLQHSR